MADSNDVDVFVSYAHDDRPRVRPLVDQFKAAGLSIWWDTEIEVGNRWRDVIYDRLTHAKSVCVFWSNISTARDFVLDEAEEGRKRGILIPILLDAIKPPLGFGQIQFRSLADPTTVDEEMAHIIASIRKLCKQGAKVDGWETIDRGVQYTRSAAKQADRFLNDVRVRSDLLKQNPGSAQALRDALQGVRQTYEAVNDAIDQFLVPVKAHSDPELSLYASIASGRMIQEIERRRGHCKSITALYIESGGLRDALPATVSREAKEALDDLMQSISHADLDLFQEMTGVGSALAKEAAVITNLLLADQTQAANDHLRECASKLIPLQADLSEGMGRVDHLMLDLGIAL